MRRSLVMALLLTLVSGESQAATILQREIELDIRGGEVLRSTSMLVELTRPADVDGWSLFQIDLNEQIELVRTSAEVLDGNGKILEKIPRKKHFRIESTGDSLYSSSWASVIPFPSLAVGQRLRIHYTTRERPYYPADTIAVVLTQPQTQLEVRVEGGDDLLWRLDDSSGSFEVQETEGGLKLSAQDVPAYVSLRHAPAFMAAIPLLRVSWGRPGTWKDVGVWYEDLSAGVPRDDPGIAGLASSLVEGISSPREQIRILSEHVRRNIRYEAVQIGVGGYVPTPAVEVRKRAWGDCKDKAELLAQMLAAVGISSHPALVYSGTEGSIDAEFPSPFQFNHLILGIPAVEAGALPGDPVADDLLFVDPTWERGTLGWLAASDRGRPVLVVDGEATRLVAVPDSPAAETRTLEVGGKLTLNGDLEGTVRVEMIGSQAIAWIEDMESAEDQRNEEDFRRLVGGTLTGSKLSDIRWRELENGVPAVELKAGLAQPKIVRGQPGRRLLRAEALDLFPEPRVLDDRSVPITLVPGVHRTSWSVTVPPGWCPAEPVDERVENEQGRFVVRVSSDRETSTLTMTQEAVLNHSWVGPDQFESLKALAVAESRLAKRQIRIRCPKEATAGGR